MKYFDICKNVKVFGIIPFLILVLFSKISFSQQFYFITYGNLDTYEVTVDSFKNQKGLMVPKGYTLDSATAYFYFPKQKEFFTAEYRPDFDSIKFFKYVNLLVPGSIVSFEGIRLSNAQGYTFRPHNQVKYHFVGTAPRKKSKKSRND